MMTEIDELIKQRYCFFFGPSAVKGNPVFATIRDNIGNTVATGKGTHAMAALRDAVSNLTGRALAPVAAPAPRQMPGMPAVRKLPGM